MNGNGDPQWPAGYDLRDGIFSAGLPAGAYRRHDMVPVLTGLLGERVGADDAPKMPPYPNVTQPDAIQAYLVDVWYVIASQHGDVTAHSPAAAAWARMRTVQPAETPQDAVAAMISAGPGLDVPGSDRLQRVMTALSQAIQGQTGQAPISVVPGSLGVAAAVTAATAAAAAAATAAAAAKETGDPDRASLAVSVARYAAELQAAAIDAVRGAAETVPDVDGAGLMQTVANAGLSVIGDLAGIPGETMRALTSVPVGAISAFESITTEWIRDAAALVDQGIGTMDKTLASFIRTMRIGLVLNAAAMTAVGLILAAVTFGPQIAATRAASKKWH